MKHGKEIWSSGDWWLCFSAILRVHLAIFSKLLPDKLQGFVGSQIEAIRTIRFFCLELALSILDHENTTSALLTKLRRLATLRPSVCFLPSLRTLHCHVMFPKNLGHAMPFISRSVKTFPAHAEDTCQVVPWADWDIPMRFLLLRLQEKAESLLSLEFSNFFYVKALCEDPMRGLLEASPALTNFVGSLNALSSTLLSALASLPKLRHMAIIESDRGTQISVTPDTIKISLHGNGFTSLKKLEIESGSQIAAALSGSIHASMEELTVKTWMISFGEDRLFQLTESISSLSDSLVTLHLTLVLTLTRDEPLTWQELSAVLKCGSMHRFSLTFESLPEFDLHDTHLDAIAHALPKLMEFSIRWTDDVEQCLDAVTLAGLAPFARYCPTLLHIFLTNINCSVDLPAPPEEPVPSPILLDAGASQISELEHVALFLALLWEDIEVIHDSGEDADGWESVINTLNIMRCVKNVRSKPGLLGQFRGQTLSAMNDSVLRG